MKANRFYVWFCLLFSVPLMAQTEVIIKGKVVQRKEPLAGVHIQNIERKTFATTDINGQFFIKVEEGNTLKFTHVGKKPYHTIIKREDLEKLLVVELTDEAIELEGVDVQKLPDIEAKDFLGYKPKERTFEEKRVYTNNNYWAGSGFPPINILAVLNTISGQRKYYKQALKNERNLFVANYIIDNMTESLKKNLQLTDEKIAILAFYVMENTEIHDVVKSKNDKQLEFLLTDVWVTDLSKKIENGIKK